MNFTQITPPVALPVELEAAKHRMRVDYSEDDDDITDMITAATAFLDGAQGYLGRCLITQTWELSIDWTFPNGDIPISLGPVQSINSLKYIDEDGAEQEISDCVLTVGSNFQPSYVAPAFGSSWPKTRCQRRAVVIEFDAGYGGASDVPAQIRQAILTMVTNWYRDREGDQSSITPGAESMLAQHRCVVL